MAMCHTSQLHTAKGMPTQQFFTTIPSSSSGLWSKSTCQLLQPEQGGPRMLKIAQGQQIFFVASGSTPLPPPSQNGYVRLKKEISKKLMKFF